MDITRWSIPKSDWLYPLQPKMEKLYTVNKNKTRSGLWLRSWTPYYQIQTQMKKVGKTTRPFRYDLNQIPYAYTVEVTNRFKGLDLMTECLKNYAWRFMTLYRRQWLRPSPIKRKAKWLSEEALQTDKKWREAKGKEKRKDIPIWMQSSKEYQGELRKPSSVINAKKYRKQIEWERLEISSIKLEIPREYFMQRWAKLRTEMVWT